MSRPLNSSLPLTVQGTLIARTLYLAYDHKGQTVGESLIKFLHNCSYKVEHVGDSKESYVTNAANVAARIDETTAGILICGTGMGMCIVANRYKTVAAVRCLTVQDAERSREINNANVLCLPSDIPLDQLKAMVRVWLATSYDGRKIENISKIMNLEVL